MSPPVARDFIMGRLVFLLSLLAPGQKLELPTPLEHYQTYDWEADARALALEIAATAPEEARARAAALLEGSTPGGEFAKFSIPSTGAATAAGSREFFSTAPASSRSFPRRPRDGARSSTTPF